MKVELSDGEEVRVERGQRWEVIADPSDPMSIRCTIQVERVHEDFFLYRRIDVPFNTRALTGEAFAVLASVGSAMPVESEEVRGVGC